MLWLRPLDMRNETHTAGVVFRLFAVQAVLIVLVHAKRSAGRIAQVRLAHRLTKRLRFGLKNHGLFGHHILRMPTYRVARWLVNLLNPLVKKSPTNGNVLYKLDNNYNRVCFQAGNDY